MYVYNKCKLMSIPMIFLLLLWDKLLRFSWIQCWNFLSFMKKLYLNKSITYFQCLLKGVYFIIRTVGFWVWRRKTLIKFSHRYVLTVPESLLCTAHQVFAHEKCTPSQTLLGEKSITKKKSWAARRRRMISATQIM